VLLGAFVIVVRAAYQVQHVNPQVVSELRRFPDSNTATRVTVLTVMENGVPAHAVPVNYLREDNKVFLAAYGPWWREFNNGAAPVTLLIKGEELSGQAIAVVDDAAYTEKVFARLRPDVSGWLPGLLNGVLVVVDLDEITLADIQAAAAKQAEDATAAIELENAIGSNRRLFESGERLPNISRDDN
jgi:hypothetical protein